MDKVDVKIKVNKYLGMDGVVFWKQVVSAHFAHNAWRRRVALVNFKIGAVAGHQQFWKRQFLAGSVFTARY
jgi:hypothetical protein